MCFSIINSIWFYLMLENKGESEQGREGGMGNWKENGDIIRLVHDTASSNIVCDAISPRPLRRSQTTPTPPTPQTRKSHIAIRFLNWYALTNPDRLTHRTEETRHGTVLT